jgi:hypothetical protein
MPDLRNFAFTRICPVTILMVIKLRRSRCRLEVRVTSPFHQICKAVTNHLHTSRGQGSIKIEYSYKNLWYSMISILRFPHGNRFYENDLESI